MDKFNLSNEMNVTEVYNLLKANMSKCPDIVDISVNEKFNMIKLKGKYDKYTVSVTKDRDNLIFVTPSNNLFIVIAIMICFFPLGIYYAIKYARGKSEKEAIMQYIYNTLNSKQ